MRINTWSHQGLDLDQLAADLAGGVGDHACGCDNIDCPGLRQDWSCRGCRKDRDRRQDGEAEHSTLHQLH
jgi:hypothetical protein